ncbi:hypothetical protein SAMN05216251_11559 [Actinacidiphila alni]|uniref:Toxin-antitoxin system HicB family antitoxin n=1 Tax=Actinacidiphila alni TaxID=380248 RepID=A0A1I2J0H1_9ACTN|nr:hypothetical protein [Actinacidiphila alni]SFF46757.1 hypothetical protein SAMN05216251_11559 [Actinacidiphila alni]
MTTSDEAPAERPAARARARKQVLLRLDPAVHDALASWAAGELRSTNAQIEFLLRRALAEAGRLPSAARPIPRRGRPPKQPESAENAEGTEGTEGAPGG